MTFLRRNSSNLLLCVGELVVGILLLVNPVGFTRSIIMALGAVIALVGLFNIFRYFRTDPVRAAAERRLAYGLGQLALGAFALTHSSWLVGLFPVLTRLYGAGVLLLALFRIQQFVDVRRLKLAKGWISGVCAFFTLAYAALILFQPETTWMFVGIMLLLEAVMDILILYFDRRG